MCLVINMFRSLVSQLLGLCQHPVLDTKDSTSDYLVVWTGGTYC